MISLAKSQRAQRVELSEKEHNGIAGDTTMVSPAKPLMMS